MSSPGSAPRGPAPVGAGDRARRAGGRGAAGGLLGLGLGLGLWQLVALRVGPLLLPSPLSVLAALWNERALLLGASAQTAAGALAGLGVAVGAGVAVAVASWASGALRAALAPWAVFVQVVPIAAVAPLLIVWVGYGFPVAAITAAIAAFYPVFSAASTGLVAPQAEWVELLRLYRASRWRELWDLRVPAALPAFFSGLRSAAGLAVIGGIVGEFVGSNGDPPTLGSLVVQAQRSAALDLGFAAIGMASTLALLLHALVRLAERRLIGRWYGA